MRDDLKRNRCVKCQNTAVLNGPMCKNFSKTILQQKYLEIGRVHAQHEGMQLAEIKQTCSEVIDPFDSIEDSLYHCQSMLPHLDRAWAQVIPVREIRLCLRIDK